MAIQKAKPIGVAISCNVQLQNKTGTINTNNKTVLIIKSVQLVFDLFSYYKGVAKRTTLHHVVPWISVRIIHVCMHGRYFYQVSTLTRALHSCICKHVLCDSMKIIAIPRDSYIYLPNI